MAIFYNLEMEAVNGTSTDPTNTAALNFNENSDVGLIIAKIKGFDAQEDLSKVIFTPDTANNAPGDDFGRYGIKWDAGFNSWVVYLKRPNGDTTTPASALWNSEDKNGPANVWTNQIQFSVTFQAGYTPRADYGLAFTFNIQNVNEAVSAINFTNAQTTTAGTTQENANVVKSTWVDPDLVLAFKNNKYAFLVNGSLDTSDGKFTINETTGQVTTNAAITSADGTFKDLVIVAYDAGDNSLQKQQAYRVNIVQAAPTPVVEFDAASVALTQEEGTGAGTTTFTYTITRTGQDLSAQSIVNWAVAAGTADAADFGGMLPSGTVTFAAGQTAQTISFTVARDTTFEQNETFTVNLTAGTNAQIAATNNTATGTITNDDNTAPPVPSGSFNVNEGTADDQTVATLAATDADGQAVSYTFQGGGLISADGKFEIVGNTIRTNGPVAAVTTDTPIAYTVVANDGSGMANATSTGTVTITIKDVPPSGQTLGLTWTGDGDYPATDSGASVAAFGDLEITGDGNLTLRIAFDEDDGVLENIGSVVPTYNSGQIVYLFTGTQETLEVLLDNLKFNPFNRAAASANPVTTQFAITLDDGDPATNNAVTNSEIKVVTQIIGNHAPVVAVPDGADVTKAVDTGPHCHPFKGLTFFDDEYDTLTVKVEFLKDHGDLVIPDGISWTREDVSANNGPHYWRYTFTGKAAALQVMMDVIKFDAAPVTDAAGTIRTTDFDISVTDHALGRTPVLEQVQVKAVAGKAALSNAVVREQTLVGTKVGDLTPGELGPDGKAFAYQIVLADGTTAATDGRFKIGADGKSIEVANGALLDYEQVRSYGLKLKVTIADGDQDASNNLWFLQDVTLQVADWVSESVVGTTGNDRIYANLGNDLLKGNSGNDTLMGGAGTDRLYGEAGNDWLYGGAGNADLLYGGKGSSSRDVFVFNTALNAKTNKDWIKDWEYQYDTINLENAVFKALKKTGKLSSKNFKLGAKAGDADDYVGYNSLTGDVWYDSNGSKAGGQVVFANIGKKQKVFYSDFIVI